MQSNNGTDPHFMLLQMVSSTNLMSYTVAYHIFQNVLSMLNQTFLVNQVLTM